ncbi:hypothetical protein [Vreelandella alkaliphila]|nr:hypothetical protein [Halomonas sp. KG2]
MLNPFSMQGKVGIVAGLANQDSDAGASLTGLTHYVDAGHHIRF